jgi:hypothetical protein
VRDACRIFVGRPKRKGLLLGLSVSEAYDISLRNNLSEGLKYVGASTSRNPMASKACYIDRITFASVSGFAIIIKY